MVVVKFLIARVTAGTSLGAHSGRVDMIFSSSMLGSPRIEIWSETEREDEQLQIMSLKSERQCSKPALLPNVQLFS